MVDEQHAARDIHLLTTDALLADLIGARAIAVGAGKHFSLDTDDARTVLDWYRRNRGKWAGNLAAVDVEAIVDTIGTAPPVTENAVEDGAVRTNRTLQLVKVVAHRFAGLHVYGRTAEPPETFVFEPSKAVTLFEGANGSGKTSIANAIVWCLTGHLIRSQRAPEQGPTEFICEIARDGGAVTQHRMSAITPMPHKSSDLPADSGDIPADSWVELTFVDVDGVTLSPIRRSQSRTARGKISETEPDLDTTGVDPIAWRIATTMPALLPFLAVGSTSQLGEAVARLTGLADLVDLAKHAGKASERIANRSVKDLEGQLADIAEHYREAVGDLSATMTETPSIRFDGEIPAIGASYAQDRIKAIGDHFVGMKAHALAQAREVLGAAFEPEDKGARDNLEASIRPAIERLKQLGNLPSIARLSALTWKGDEAALIETLLGRIQTEAATLAELASSPDIARRAQLYARVSGWMHEHGHSDDGRCPVCVGPLSGALDPVTGAAVSDHLAKAAQDREVIARTVVEWSQHWVGQLLRELPEVIGKEARADLPATPADLLRAGLIDDLFTTEPFQGALSALRSGAATLVDERLTSLPQFVEPARRILPQELSAASALQVMIDRIVRASAFAEWRGTSGEALKSFVNAVRSGEEGAVDKERALSRRLSSLLSIVEGVGPINKAIEFVARMERNRAAYVGKQARIAACRRAVAALGALVPIGDLAQVQVETLRTKLHRRSEYWRRLMYLNATGFAPDLTETGMDARGVLELKVGREGVAAPAQHVSNASALRGALLGFFLAFREHVLATRGGPSLLVLDDPQELLDNDNRERLARGLGSLTANGTQLVVTTHDRKFAGCIVAENRPEDRVAHLSVHPVNSVRPTLVVSPATEEVDGKRQAFVNSPDSAPHARDYASDLRVFLESRLGDLFDDSAHPAYAAGTKPLTLNPLMDKLRGLISDGTGELFTNQVVKRFARDAALAEGAEARRVLNASHHNKASISYMDVKSVEADLVRLRKDVEKVHEQFRLYRWREPLAPPNAEDTAVTPLRPMAKPTFSIPIHPDIAAFIGRSPGGGSQDIATEQLDGNWFDGKALYYIKGETLGFSIPSGSVAIVDAEPYPGRDQNLVIAKSKGQVHARRMTSSVGSINISLSTQMPDPRTNRPTLGFDKSKVRLYRIVGAIFSDMPPPMGGGEAVLIDAVPELEQVAAAYRVKEDSALPLALPGQVILGGDELSSADLDAWEGRLVAVTLEDGSSIFKRVGARLPGAFGHLRQFETIGGLGSSIVIGTEAIEGGDAAVPVVASARRVIGVLYDNG